MKINFAKIFFACTAILLVCAAISGAQTVTGSITGEVTDPSGAVIANAQVVAHNLDTGVDSSTTTNSTGLYRLQFLPIGHYQVAVQANGFESQTIPPFAL